MKEKLVVRGVLTRPRDFGKTGEEIVIADWVNRDLLVKRLNALVFGGDLRPLIKELEEKGV